MQIHPLKFAHAISFELRSCHLLRAALEAQDREIPAIYGGVAIARPALATAERHSLPSGSLSCAGSAADGRTSSCARSTGEGDARDIWRPRCSEAQASPAIYGGGEIARPRPPPSPWALPFRQPPCPVPAAQLLGRLRAALEAQDRETPAIYGGVAIARPALATAERHSLPSGSCAGGAAAGKSPL